MTEAPSTDSDLHQAKLLIKDGKFSVASTRLDEILKHKPRHRDALYYLAVCHRMKREHEDALKVLRGLTNAHPGYGRAYQEVGHNQLKLSNADAAGRAYEEAVRMNPALLSSWQALIGYRATMNDRDGAEVAKQQAKALAALPAELLTVTSLIHEQKLFVAEQIVRQFLSKNKHQKDAMRLLAKIGSELQILDDAEFLLESCVEFYPDYGQARMDYVQVLHRRQKFQKALKQAKILVKKSPKNTGAKVLLANELQAVGNFDRALEIYDHVLDEGGDMHAVYSARGHALKTVGRTEDAIESYRAAYRVKLDYGDAYWSLANLKTYAFTDDEFTAMRAHESAAGTSAEDRAHLCFALGKALEDREEFDESFAFYQKGNQLKQATSQYDFERLARDFELSKELFDESFFSKRDGEEWGCQNSAPIFIVGLPRAGSTLLEQILASHSQVDGTMELANVIGLAHRLNGRRANQEEPAYPKILCDLDAKQCLKFGADFIKDTAYHREGGLYFIDKMPNNFRHIALIQLMLPHAKIIDARREPMACCFSGFKQLFAEGQEFTYGLERIGQYYRAYVDLMNHWNKVLPGKILKVQHEDVIEDLPGQVERILDFCGLNFEQGCVDFHQTERAVRTPSSEQVRQPIFRSGMDQWRNYERHLQPLVEALGPALENY